MSGAVTSILIVAAVIISLITCLFLCRHFSSCRVNVSPDTEKMDKTLSKASEQSDVESGRRSSARSSLRKDEPVDTVVERVDNTLRALGEAPAHISHLGMAAQPQWSDPHRLRHASTDGTLPNASPRSQDSSGKQQERGENSKRGSSPSPLVALGLAPGSRQLPGRDHRRSSSEEPQSSISETEGGDISIRHTRSDISGRREQGSDSNIPGVVRSPRPQGVRSAPVGRRSWAEEGQDLQEKRRSSLSPGPSERSRRSRSPSPLPRRASGDQHGPQATFVPSPK